MKKAPQLTTENPTNKKPETTNKTIWQKMKNTRLAAVTAIAMAFASCEKDEPIIEKLNKDPINTFVFKKLDLDGDGKVNDLMAKHTAIDNDGNIEWKEAVIKMGATEIGRFNDNEEHTYKDVENSSYTTTFTSEDNEGGNDTDTKNITVDVAAPTTNYSAETTIETNDINEETSGKIATITTVTKKIVNDNSSSTETTITGGTFNYVITGPDKDLLEIKNGNEVHVKATKGKDVENAEGNDVEANKKYDFGIETTVSGLDGNNTANDTDTAANTPDANNLDFDDFEPFDAGLLIEKNGDIPVEYTNTIANPDNLITSWSEARSESLIDKMIEISGSRFTKIEFILPSGNKVFYVGVDGKRLAKKSFSQILDGIYKSLLDDQNAAMPNTSDRVNWLISSDMTTYLSKGLNAISFTDYTGTTADADYDIGAEIICTPLDAGKVGAAANVARNIAIGAYN